MANFSKVSWGDGEEYFLELLDNKTVRFYCTRGGAHTTISAPDFFKAVRSLEGMYERFPLNK